MLSSRMNEIGHYSKAQTTKKKKKRRKKSLLHHLVTPMQKHFFLCVDLHRIKRCKFYGKQLIFRKQHNTVLWYCSYTTNIFSFSYWKHPVKKKSLLALANRHFSHCAALKKKKNSGENKDKQEFLSLQIQFSIFRNYQIITYMF